VYRLFDAFGSMHDGFSLPQTSWIALLSITHRYDFPNVRSRAIREIFGSRTTRQPAEQQQDHMLLISVAEKYDVPPKHILPSLIALVRRSQPLTEDEVAHYSALTVSRLARAREDYVREVTARFILPDFPSSAADATAKSIVCKIWQIQQSG
jgi:hypothetical protein